MDGLEKKRAEQEYVKRELFAYDLLLRTVAPAIVSIFALLALPPEKKVLFVLPSFLSVWQYLLMRHNKHRLSELRNQFPDITK